MLFAETSIHYPADEIPHRRVGGEAGGDDALGLFRDTKGLLLTL